MIRYSILVADENKRTRDAFRSELEPRGYNVLNAESGLETLKIIKNEDIHLIVLDVRLPDYSGLEIYHAIKDFRRGFLPCIFTAQEMSAKSFQDALDEEAITILPKPVDMTRFLRAVGLSINKFYAGEGLTGVNNNPSFNSFTQRRKDAKTQP